MTVFWREYGRALACLHHRRSYSPAALKLKGYEKYWLPYLEVVAALTQGADPGAAIQGARSSFLKRNSDKRLRDWSMTDGDGLKPVRWDFRLASILAFWSAAS